MLCIRVLTVFLCPGPGHRAVIASPFPIQVVGSDRDLVALVFQKTPGFVGVKLTVWNLYWKCMTRLSLWFKRHGESNVVTVPCFLGRNLREANKCQLLNEDCKTHQNFNILLTNFRSLPENTVFWMWTICPLERICAQALFPSVFPFFYFKCNLQFFFSLQLMQLN